MKTISILAIAAAFMLAFLAEPVTAEEQQQTKQQATGQQQQQKPLQAAGMHKASDLMGKTITSQQGEELGNINDLLVSEQGEVQYIILSRGEVLGMGGELVPVPWQAANLQMQQDKLVSSLDKQKIENAPSFKSDQWAQFTEPGYEQEVHSYYGTQQQQQQEGFQQTPETEPQQQMQY
jgi:sporulation protein YlmC with PRC-barrel domain